MRKFCLPLLALCVASMLHASWKDTLNSSMSAINSANSSSSGDYKSLVTSALNAAVDQLSKDGFLNSATAKIPLPSSLQTAANLAKKVGGEKLANELVVSMNKAAGEAVPKAANVFSDTIKNMSEADVKKVLGGSEDSFTKFLQERSGKNLQKVFKPIIEKMMSDNSFATAYNKLNSLVANNALTNSDTAKSLKNLASDLGAGEYITQQNEDMNDYITRKTLEGLFKVMSEKESGLRGGTLGKGTKILNDILK
ncbi:MULTISPECIES: DUF4197 domain-containing protein [Campylobacter]|uniref:DUF4197 domain-containing protein n=1 Tax=Campylobacter TaxID=194 RepID=UPI00147027EC|nr:MULTISPECIES: DUF4197 domain-containing protein [Campylobacter]MBN7288076.1 DUF4197 domain-containing protein [Campylobacter curvus]MDU6828031.1 DUF4197 domain-containing protein [Campylobacter sp.]